jgi:HemK-like putative methylase/proline-specific peptidase
MTLGDALAAATARLAEAGIESARLEAELLLARACDDCARALLYAELDRELTPEQEAAFEANVSRRVRREPLAYVLGEWGFRRLTLKTDRRALIPRPETEIVVERALEHIRDEPDPDVLDVGTGTGAIALAIADEHAGARITAIDASPEALALADENRELTGVDGRVNLVEHDLTTGLGSSQFDLVVSNPPYVEPDELPTLQPEVRDWRADPGAPERAWLRAGYDHPGSRRKGPRGRRQVDGLKTEDGRTLAYRREGSGPTLVCHGGGPGFSSLYLGNLGGLDERLELVLLDPRGTGGSDRPADPRGYAIDDYVDDLEEFRLHLGLERINLFGHSHGGVVAIAYAARHPERVERLILASALARWAPEQAAAMEASVASHAGEPWYADAKAALEAEQAGDFATDEEMEELAFREFPFYFAEYGDEERAYLETLRADNANADPLRQFNEEIFETFDLRPDLEKITAPTLVVTGAEDFITGPPSAAEIEHGLSDVVKVVIPNCGHFVFFEAPEAFTEAVVSFLGVPSAA